MPTCSVLVLVVTVVVFDGLLFDMTLSRLGPKMFTGDMNCHWSDLAVVHQHSKRHGANQRSDGDGSLKSIRHLDWHNPTKGEWAYIANDNNCSRNAHN